MMIPPEPQRPYVGVHLLLIHDNKLLLIKRSVKDEQQGMYALIAGKAVEFYFTAKQWAGTPTNKEPEKASEMAFFSMDNLPSPLPKGLKSALAALQGGSSFIELKY